MKRFVLLIALILPFVAVSQIFNPVSWEVRAVAVDDRTYRLEFEASMEPEWAIYSQFVDEGGPIPTQVTFEQITGMELVGSVTEDEAARITKHDPVFDMVVGKFYNNALFTQTVKITDASAGISGYLMYMTCNDERCLAPTDVNFSFEYSPEAGLVFSDPAEAGAGEIQASDDVNMMLYGISLISGSA